MFFSGFLSKLVPEMSRFLVVSIFTFIIFTNCAEGIIRRCYQCRSRGEKGNCKDPFKYNSTQAENQHGLQVIPCASGWCGKVIEGQETYREDDYDSAVQRMCVQRGPDDNEDRCAHTVYNYKKVYMCFCQGDLCNGSSSVGASWGVLVAFSIIGFTMRVLF